MSKLNINQFKDLSGHTWTFGITIGTYLKIKSETGVDVTNIAGDDSWLARFAIHEDISELITMVVIVLEDQLDREGVTTEEFLGRIGSEEIKPMIDALLGGVVNFTPAHKREPILRTVAMIQSQAKKLTQEVLDKMDEMEEILEDQSPIEAISHLEKLRESFSNPQESSE